MGDRNSRPKDKSIAWWNYSAGRAEKRRKELDKEYGYFGWAQSIMANRLIANRREQQAQRPLVNPRDYDIPEDILNSLPPLVPMSRLLSRMPNKPSPNWKARADTAYWKAKEKRLFTKEVFTKVSAGKKFVNSLTRKIPSTARYLKPSGVNPLPISEEDQFKMDVYSKIEDPIKNWPTTLVKKRKTKPAAPLVNKLVKPPKNRIDSYWLPAPQTVANKPKSWRVYGETVQTAKPPLQSRDYKMGDDLMDDYIKAHKPPLQGQQPSEKYNPSQSTVAGFSRRKLTSTFKPYQPPKKKFRQDLSSEKI